MKATGIDYQIERRNRVVREDVGLHQLQLDTRSKSALPRKRQCSRDEVNTDNRESQLRKVDGMNAGTAADVQHSAVTAPFSRGAQ